MSLPEEILRMPDLITLDNYGGNFKEYYEGVYQVFKSDLLRGNLTFKGKRIALKAHPRQDDKESTFYHITHDGSDENNRSPNMRRMERMPYVRALIENCDHCYLKIWKNTRGNKERILIYHEAESYVLILENRGDFVLIWTAYYVEHDNQRRKLLKEYEAYKKAETAQRN